MLIIVNCTFTSNLKTKWGHRWLLLKSLNLKTRFLNAAERTVGMLLAALEKLMPGHMPVLTFMRL